MNIGQIIHFHDERFFDGAVQLSWVQRRNEQAHQVAESFVFHGPRYHGVSEEDIQAGKSDFKLKDTASFCQDFLNSILNGISGKEINPYWLVIAGYGSGKSHLAVTLATLLSEPHSKTSLKIIEQLQKADKKISETVEKQISELKKPVLILPLDGMAGFHLGNALSRAVFNQLAFHNIDAGAIRELSPRFQIAEKFVERNFENRRERFSKYLKDYNAEQICSELREHNETIYKAVDTVYEEANGNPIPIEGQESSQELIETLSDIYCGPDKYFSQIVILFDEFGRYLEYASEKPQLAGDANLQQIFQGVQDNNTKVRFVGFIQYELKTYLKRFGEYDLHQLQRYITRFDTSEKWHLSTNLETIFARMIGKNEENLQILWEETNAKEKIKKTWEHIYNILPSFSHSPIWSDFQTFSRVVAKGCWPLHPLAVWFLTQQKDLVQSRSALTFIKDIIDEISDEAAVIDGNPRQVSAAELVLRNMLPELIAAERDTGGSIAEILQMLLEKFRGHIDDVQRLILAGVAVIEKIRIGKQNRETVNVLLSEVTNLHPDILPQNIEAISNLGAMEWNEDLGQYELLSDGATRGQFQHLLRSHYQELSADRIRDIFARHAVTSCDLNPISTDFGDAHDITTPDWFFQAQYAHINNIGNIISISFQDWEQAFLPKDAKGKVIYTYLHPSDDLNKAEEIIRSTFDVELRRRNISKAPIWVIVLADHKGILSENIGKRFILEEKISPSEKERFRRFIPDELTQCQDSLKESSQNLLKEGLFGVAGFAQVPKARLRIVGTNIFQTIYSKAIPFPFDGFASSSGGGPLDVVTLIRALVTQQVNGQWAQAQPKRLQNRLNSVLIKSWKAFLPSGKLFCPSEKLVKELFTLLETEHRSNSSKTLFDSYEVLLKPPYGLNASSAGLMLSLLIGIDNPPRRIEFDHQMIASGEWIQKALSDQKGRHYLDEIILKKTTLKFLSEDSISRWKTLLSQWEEATEYSRISLFFREAEKMARIDPLPEVLEGNFKYLQDKTRDVEEKLANKTNRIESFERQIDTISKRNDIAEAISLAGKANYEIKKMKEEGVWPSDFINDDELILKNAKEVIAQGILNWIPRQSCQNAIHALEFREKMGARIKTLKEIGYRNEAQLLEKQVETSILRVEESQKFSMTIAQCEDYPRQPTPTNSTPVRQLRDDIAKGESLIQGISRASNILSKIEIDAHINEIKLYQEKLKTALKRNEESLEKFYSIELKSEEDLQESLITLNRLRVIFQETPDESDIQDLITIVSRILSDIEIWEIDGMAQEQLQKILEDQVKHQVSSLLDLLESKNIESNWNLLEIYRSIMQEKLSIIARQSNEWTRARMGVESTISSYKKEECLAMIKELSSPPTYLSQQDLEVVKKLQDSLEKRLKAIEELNRQESVLAWKKNFPPREMIPSLDLHTTESFLKNITNPPCELSSDEQKEITSITSQILEHLDQISMDELSARIQSLPKKNLKQILKLIESLLVT